MKYLGKITDNKDLVTKEYVDKKSYFGVCSTAANAQVKEVTIDGITELFTGLHVSIYFSNEQGYDGTVQLKINNLDAKNIKRRGSTGVSYHEWYTNTLVDMVYTGSVFTLVNGTHASVSYYGSTILSSATNSTDTDKAATPSAVKSAYDLANAALPGSALVTSVDSSSTDSQVPSAKLLYDTTEKHLKPFVRTLLISSSEWTGSGPYEFVLNFTNIRYTPTVYTKADIEAPADTITQMITDGIKAMYVENDNGELTLVSVGATPSVPISIQITLYETAMVPVITSQSTSASYSVGDTITLTVTATGATGYQWLYSNNGGSTWSNGSCTSDTYSWTASTQQNGRWYRCRVNNDVGSTVSDVIIITVS